MYKNSRTFNTLISNLKEGVVKSLVFATIHDRPTIFGIFVPSLFAVHFGLLDGIKEIDHQITLANDNGNATMG